MTVDRDRSDPNVDGTSTSDRSSKSVSDLSQAELDKALLSRLQSMQRPTWELELLISGAVVFSLFQLPGRLNGWYAGIDPHVGREAGLLPFLLFYFSTLLVICLAVAFSLHFVLRSVWVGLTGLHSVFPKGIEWDRVDIGPAAKVVAQDLNPSLGSAADRIDRVASSVFAILFAIIVSMSSAFLVMLVPFMLVELLRARYFPDVSSLASLYALMAVVLLVTMPANFLDLWFKKRPARTTEHPRLFAFTVRMGRFVQRLFLGRLTSPILLTLSSRFSLQRVTAGLMAAILLSIAIFMAFFLTTLGVFGFDSYVFYPARGSDAILESAHYEDRRGAKDTSRLPTVPSETIDGRFLRVFVPFHSSRDGERVVATCPDLEPQRSNGLFVRRRTGSADRDFDARLLDCVQGTYRLQLNGETMAADWAFSEHPTNGLKGLVGYLDLGVLGAGGHALTVERFAEPGEGTVEGTESLARPIASSDRHEIRFWKSSEATTAVPERPEQSQVTGEAADGEPADAAAEL